MTQFVGTTKERRLTNTTIKNHGSKLLKGKIVGEVPKHSLAFKTMLKLSPTNQGPKIELGIERRSSHKKKKKNLSM